MFFCDFDMSQTMTSVFLKQFLILRPKVPKFYFLLVLWDANCDFSTGTTLS